MHRPSARRQRTRSRACCATISQERIAIPGSSAATGSRVEPQDVERSNPVKLEARPENTSWEPETSACSQQGRQIVACEVRREHPIEAGNLEFPPAALSNGRGRSMRIHDEKENLQRALSCQFQVRR